MTQSPVFGRRADPPAPTRLAPTPPAKVRPRWEPPVVAAETDVTVEPAAPDKAPYLTIVLLTLLAMVFVFEQSGGLPSGPGLSFSLSTLVAAGGLSRDLLEQGEWWRIFTAPLLHGDLAHIIGNSVVMVLAAVTLERLIGRAWLAATFVVSALGGAAASVLLNPPDVVTVGASGAIMGLLAMVLASSLHFAALDHAKRLRWVAFRLLIPSLIPFGAASGSAIDYNAHMGGAAAGGLMGFILLVAWPEEEDQPRLGAVAAGIGWLGLTAAIVAFALVTTRHETYIARGRLLAPDYLLPRKGWGTEAEARDLLARYPHDPRVRLITGRNYLEARNPLNAERELRQGLSETEILARDMPDSVEEMLRYFLVSALVGQGRLSAAAVEAKPLCHLPLRPQTKGPREAMAQAGFCPALTRP